MVRFDLLGTYAVGFAIMPISYAIVSYYENTYVKPKVIYFRDKSALYGKPPEARTEPSW